LTIALRVKYKTSPHIPVIPANATIRKKLY
jgi:hypothetical protein